MQLGGLQESQSDTFVTGSLERSNRTGRVRQFILSALDSVLETFSLAPGRGDFGLHLFAAHIGSHDDGRIK